MEKRPLSPNLSRKDVVVERSADVVLYSEIAARLLEIMETEDNGDTKAFGFIARLYAIGTIDPEAFRMVVALSTGDLAQITATYSQLGKSRHRTKQAQQQATERVIRSLKLHFPKLAEVIIEIRHITAQIDPAKPHEHPRAHHRHLVPATGHDDHLADRADIEEMV